MEQLLGLSLSCPAQLVWAFNPTTQILSAWKAYHTMEILLDIRLPQFPMVAQQRIGMAEVNMPEVFWTIMSQVKRIIKEIMRIWGRLARVVNLNKSSMEMQVQAQLDIHYRPHRLRPWFLNHLSNKIISRINNSRMEGKTVWWFQVEPVALEKKLYTNI